MKTKAVLMALAMMTTALAGCTSGTDGVPEVDEDALNELIQNNLQDFINNTTVVVNQDFHYHNNTTYVVDDGDYSTNVMNEYNNTTNIDGGEVNNYNSDNSNTNYTLGGGGSGTSIMQMFTVEWDWESVEQYDYGNHTIILDGTLQQNSGNPALIYATYYNGYNIEFSGINCEQFLNFQSLGDNQWREYLVEQYGYSSDSYEVAEDIRDAFSNAVDDVDGQCGHWYGSEDYYVPVFEISIEQGEAIEMLAYPGDMADLILECDDGYSASYGNGSMEQYIGGQSDCTLTGVARVYDSHGFAQVQYYNDNNGSGSNSNSTSSNQPTWDASNIPSWWDYEWNYYRWWFFDSGGYSFHHSGDGYTSNPTSSPVPESFSVYFMTHFVEVYEPDTE
jgi:hypothetical protein